nr:hypothetical protein [Rhodococcus sp. USK13]
MLGPDIVYSGENALEDCAAASFELVDATDTLLIAGSSLMLRPARVSRDMQPNRARPSASSTAAGLEVTTSTHSLLTPGARPHRPKSWPLRRPVQPKWQT